MSDSEKHSKGKEVSSTAVIQTVVHGRRQGWRPIPLIYHQKAAAVRGYQKPDYQPEPDDFWKRGNYGVGFVLGPQLGGPIDIDLDCEEAIALAKPILPHTVAVFGRSGKQRSHYLFKVEEDACPTTVFRDKITGKNILEFRGDGGNQTVFPGSIHETTGELIEWSEAPFPEVPTVKKDELLRRCRLLAIGVIIVRHIWTDGFRNDPSLPLAGILAKFGWTRDEALLLFDAMSEYQGKHDPARIKTVNLTYNRWEEGKPVAGIPKLREMMGEKNDEPVDALLDLLGIKSVAKIEEYNTKYACVQLGGQRVFRTDVAPTEAPEPMDKQGFIDWNAEDIYVDPEGKTKRWANLWLMSPQRLKYPAGLDFLPGVTPEKLEQDEYKRFEGVFNLWNGWKFPNTEKPKGDCSAWLELLRTVICNNEEEAVWIINWLAHILRDPMDIPRTALVLKGNQGTGKSLLLGYFGDILGSYYFVAQTDEHIVGRFTSHLARTLLLHSEEALYAGNPKHRGIMKSLITDDQRTWEAKNVNAKQIRNLLRLALSSNERHPAPVERGDRRYSIIDGGDRELPEELRVRLVHERKNGGPEALMWYLTHEIDYQPDLIRRKVVNEASSKMMVEGLDEIHAWWYGKLASGEVLQPGFQWCSIPDRTPWPQTVSTRAMFFDFLTTYNGSQSDKQTYNRITESAFLNSMEVLLGKDVWKTKKRHQMQGQYKPDPTADDSSKLPKLTFLLNDRQTCIGVMPTLEEARRRFEVIVLKAPIDWDDEDTDIDPEDPAYVKARKRAQNNQDF